jgi:hypothetical protein
MGKERDDQYGAEETVRRRDEALLRALRTPPKPHSAMKLGKRKAKVSPKASRLGKSGTPAKVDQE